MANFNAHAQRTQTRHCTSDERCEWGFAFALILVSAIILNSFIILWCVWICVTFCEWSMCVGWILVQTTNIWLFNNYYSIVHIRLRTKRLSFDLILSKNAASSAVRRACCQLASLPIFRCHETPVSVCVSIRIKFGRRIYRLAPTTHSLSPSCSFRVKNTQNHHTGERSSSRWPPLH